MYQITINCPLGLSVPRIYSRQGLTTIILRVMFLNLDTILLKIAPFDIVLL